MRNYELTILLDGKATAAKKKRVVDKIKKIITTLKGKVGKLEDWGEKELAYKIKKSTTGIFLHFPLKLNSAAAKAINGKLRLEEEILRYLLVRN